MIWPLMQNNIIEDDINKIIAFLQQPNIKLTQGKQVRDFEQQWSNWLGVKYSIFVNSGASANLLSMLVVKLLYGTGEIILPSMTWSSDVSSVIHLGFTPVFVDINLNNLAMDYSQLLDKITPNTKAVFLTHALGFNGLNDEIINICNSKQIPLIEDCCESSGATFKNQKIGTFGLISNFSFYYGHHMTTIEGGIISTNDKDIYEILRMVRSHGLLRESLSDGLKDKYKKMVNTDVNNDFIFIYPGFNVRNTEINAILGLSQLERLDNNNNIRITNFNLFLSLLDQKKYFTDFDIEGNSNFCLPIILKHKNKKMMNKIITCLSHNGIEHRKGLISGNILNQPFLKQYEKLNKFPVSDFIQSYALYVGNYPTLDKNNIVSLCKYLESI